ncbi:hypothetical protein MHYP_G00332800 [Metynnis hypsauchen]
MHQAFCSKPKLNQLYIIVSAISAVKLATYRGWLVAEQAGDLWECPLAPLLGESVGKVVESWHATTRPELVSERQANVGHMAVIQLPGRRVEGSCCSPAWPAVTPPSLQTYWPWSSTADGCLGLPLATGFEVAAKATWPVLFLSPALP